MVTESGAVTGYTYDGDGSRNPSLMVDPEGGETGSTGTTGC